MCWQLYKETAFSGQKHECQLNTYGKLELVQLSICSTAPLNNSIKWKISETKYDTQKKSMCLGKKESEKLSVLFIILLGGWKCSFNILCVNQLHAIRI